MWTLHLLATGEWMGSLGSCLLTVTPKPETASCPSDHGTGEPSGSKCGMSTLSLKRTVVCQNPLPAESTCIVNWRSSGGWDGCYIYVERLKNTFWVPEIFLGNVKPLVVTKVTYDKRVQSGSRKINSEEYV